MITREEDIDAHALHRRGWTISAIARHLGRDRKTIRAYLRGDREPGVRARPAADPFGPFAAYCSARLAEDPHLWATTLFDEVTGLGYGRSYPTFTRQLRARGLRPHCEPCHPAKGRAVAVIEHPPGDETQWDWVELPDPPAHWGWGSKAYLLVGALAHSGRWRGWLSASMDQPHLIEGLDRITRALGGLTAAWRFDRMATVVHPGSGRVTASFAAVAKHYGVSVRPCPPRRGNRKGVVEKANHVAAQRFWRTLPDDAPEQAQQLLDIWCTRRGDVRLRATADGKASVATIAAREPLRPAPPVPFPATLSAARTVSAQALVSFRGNRYSVAPAYARATVIVRYRLSASCLDIATTAGTVIARHALAPAGAGVMIRDHGHVLALDQAAMTAASPAPPHRRKQRIPPGPAARAARCHRAAIEGRWATTMRFFNGPGLLVIDELGYLPLPAEAASALFQVISQRYLKTSTILTSNRGVGSWGEILGDTTVAAALLDRLLHRSVVLTLDGDSYRLRDHHARNDTLRATTTGTRQPLR